MIRVGSNNYNLCLFDTNALSSFLKYKKEWIIYFENQFGIDKTIICYSPFSIAELYFRKELFNEFLSFFSKFPSMMLDGYDGLFRKEIINHETGKAVQAAIFVPTNIHDKKLSNEEALRIAFRKSGFIEKAQSWKSVRKEILDGILSLKKNFRAKGKNYKIKEIDEFIFRSSVEQIGRRDLIFARKVLDRGGIIDINMFPSVKSTMYSVFYKFYVDQRKPSKSDIIDIIISSAFPYVDICITEGNLCEIFKTVQKRHDEFRNVEFYSLKKIASKIYT